MESPNLETQAPTPAPGVPTVLICPGSPLEISRMLAACPDVAAQCRLVWWGRSPRIGEKIRAEVPGARVLPCLHRGATRSRLGETAPFREWSEHALRWERVLAARRGAEVDAGMRALAASQVAEAVRVLSLVRPDAVLIKAGTRLHEAAFSAVAQSLGIPCLYTERGAFPGSLFLDSAGVGPEMMRPAAPDSSGEAAPDSSGEAAPDSSGEAAPDSSGEAAPAPNVAAATFLAQYRHDAQSAWEQPERKGGAQLRRDLGIGERERILFYAAQVENDANMVLYSPHFSSNNAFLGFVLDALGDSPGTILVAKPHPKEVAPLQAARRAGRSRLIIQREINIKDILPEAHAVLTLNSTVGFEALLYGKPVACGASSYYSHRGWTFDIDSPRDSAPLREWLRDPQSPAQNRDFTRFSHQLLNQNLFFQQPAPGLGGPAEYLQKILAAPRHCYAIDPFLLHDAEEILAQAGASYENLSASRRLGEAWRRVAVKLKR